MPSVCRSTGSGRPTVWFWACGTRGRNFESGGLATWRNFICCLPRPSDQSSGNAEGSRHGAMWFKSNINRSSPTPCESGAERVVYYDPQLRHRRCRPVAMRRGMSGWTSVLFVSLMVPCISASSSACQLIILILPNPQPIGPAWRRHGSEPARWTLWNTHGFAVFLRNVRQRRFKILKIRVWRRWMIYQVTKFIEPCKSIRNAPSAFTADARVRSRDGVPSGVAHQLCVLSL